MARWNQQPKYHIKNWSAYGYLHPHTHEVRRDLRQANEMNTQALVRITIKNIQRIAAMFIAVKDMSPAVKTTITDPFRFAAVPTKVYLIQLDGTRAEVK